MRRLFSVAFLMLLTATFAQNIIVNPQGIVVNPNPGFEVDVRLDKGGNVPSYQIGENISISVTVNADSYIYLFNVRSDGEIVQILPNNLDDAGRSNYLYAGQTKTFPPTNANYTFQIDGPSGLDKVIAVASRSELSTRTLLNLVDNGGIYSSNIGESEFASALSIIVNPLPQGDWVTDAAHFWVGNPPAQPTTGSLRVESMPDGAAVFINRDFVGYTPLTYTARGGSYDLQVQADGYETFSQRVTISNGQQTGIHAHLNQVRRTGTVSFHSQPNRADVYVDGRYLGTTPLNNQEIEAGNHTVRFERDGYEASTVSFNVSANSRQTVNGSLAAQLGNLRIRGNVGGAQVYLDGIHQGTIPSGNGILDLTGLNPGTYELTVVAPGYNTHSSTVRINSGSTADVRVQQQRR